jgi:hypothetical protein
LEIHVDRPASKAHGYRVRGTIPLQLPERDESFVITARMPAYWLVNPVNRNCKLNRFAVAVKVVGRRDQDRLRLALSLTPETLRQACGNDKAIEAASKFTVNTSDLTPRVHCWLPMADERTLEDSAHHGKLTGKLILLLSCLVELAAGESAPLISVSPADMDSWPLLFDYSKTSAELSALAATPSGVVGLTRPSKPYPPTASFLVAVRRSALRQGFCFWVKSVQG